MRLTVAFAALVMAGCVAAKAPAPAEVSAIYPLSPAQRATIQATVARNMKDPDSARFGAIFASRNAQDRIFICGYVNGKNSFGGYVGEQPFYGALVVASNISTYVHGEIGTPTNASTFRTVCAEKGISI